jgi:hypothetical protein
MTPRRPEPAPLAVILHTANAQHLRGQARREILFRLFTAIPRYAVAPFAFGLRICSSSLGKISTKLHGRYR